MEFDEEECFEDENQFLQLDVIVDVEMMCLTVLRWMDGWMDG